MDLDFSAAETAFRSMVRTFLAAELPQDIQHKVRNGLPLDSQDYMRWQRLLHRFSSSRQLLGCWRVPWTRCCDGNVA